MKENKLSEEELLNLARKIQCKQDNGLSVEDDISLFEENVSLKEAGQLFYSDLDYKYIVKRSMNHKEVPIGFFSKNELIEMVKKIMNVNGEEWELDILLDLVSQSTGDSAVSDYIYYSEKEYTAEEVVNICLRIKERSIYL